MALIEGVCQFRPPIVISLIITHIVKGGGISYVTVAFNVTLTYISSMILNSVPIEREITNRLDEAAKVLLDLDPSYLLLAVTVNLCCNIVFCL